MIYLDYRIIAEVNVNSQWDFELDEHGQICLTNFIDEGEADDDNIADLLVLDPDGEEVDWADTVEAAKKLVRADIKKRKAEAK